MKKLAISIGSILFSLIVAEIFAQLFLEESHPGQFATFQTEDFEAFYKFTESGGFRGQVEHDHDGNRLYWVQHNFDSYRRRMTPVVEGAQKAHLFFGGSFVYGHGLEDHQTLPWRFSEISNIQTYNYAFDAFGPHSMLAQLKSTDINSQIPSDIRKVDISFFSYLFHIERYLGSFGWVGRLRTSDPYFYLKGDKLVSGGNFVTGRPILTRIYWVLWRYSKLSRIVFNGWGVANNKSNQLLLCALINQSFYNLRNQLRERLGTFYFVIGPFQLTNPSDEKFVRYYEGVRRCLDSNIIAIEIKPPADFATNPATYLVHPEYDLHPNQTANSWTAKEFYKVILEHETNR